MSQLGYKVLQPTNEEISHLMANRKENVFGLNDNEYGIIHCPDGETTFSIKWSNGENKDVGYKTYKSDLLGHIKPINEEQKLAFDLMQSDCLIKCLTGIAGGGKDFIMTAHAVQGLLSGKFQRLVWIRNNIEVKDTERLGMLPGEEFDKLRPYLMPLADHLGGLHSLNMFIEKGQIDVAHLGYLRGRDLRNSIVYCSEAENLTKEHMRIIMTRCSKGTELWVNGDYKQVDKKVFEGSNNGLTSLIDGLSGYREFGHVTLKRTERGRIAELSELL